MRWRLGSIAFDTLLYLATMIDFVLLLTIWPGIATITPEVLCS